MKKVRKNLKKVAVRRCLVTGSVIGKAHLIRFVVSPSRNLIADIDQKLPGRGYWIKADREVIVKALKKNIFTKAVNHSISIDPNIIDIIQTNIKQKLINQISLSRKAGKTIFGFEKVKSYLIKNPIGLLIQAIDGSKKEKNRIMGKSLPKLIDNCLTGEELGKIFGREKVIHCAILQSGFIENIVFNANRLNNLKNPVPQYGNAELSSLDTKFYRKLSGKNNE